MTGKSQKPGLYLQQGGNKLLNMFFHKCSYKISCFSELAYKSSSVRTLCANLLNWGQMHWSHDILLMRSDNEQH